MPVSKGNAYTTCKRVRYLGALVRATVPRKVKFSLLRNTNIILLSGVDREVRGYGLYRH